MREGQPQNLRVLFVYAFLGSLQIVHALLSSPVISPYITTINARHTGMQLQSSSIVPRNEYIRPSLITFDATGTLMQLSNGVGLLYRDTLLKHCDYAIRLPRPGVFKQSFLKAFAHWSKEQPCFGCGAGSTSVQWWYQVVRDTYYGVGMTELLPNELEELLPAVFHELYHEVFATKQAWELCEETMYVLTKLAAWRDQGNGPKLGVISNFDERLHGILTDLGIIEFFDFIITSREIGAEKPSRKIFEVGMSRIRCTNPSSVVHVGDSVETDVLGAHAAGLMPVLLNEELDDVHVDWGDGSINRNPKPDPDSGIEGTEYLMSDHWRAYLEQTASKKLAAAEGIRFIQIATFDQLLTVFGFPDDPDKLIKVSVARWLTEED